MGDGLNLVKKSHLLTVSDNAVVVWMLLSWRLIILRMLRGHHEDELNEFSGSAQMCKNHVTKVTRGQGYTTNWTIGLERTELLK